MEMASCQTGGNDGPPHNEEEPVKVVASRAEWRVNGAMWLNVRNVDL